MITVSVNNEQKTIPQGYSVSEALSHWNYSNEKIAVAINSEFVPRSVYAERQLQDHDCLDIVAPVQGG